MAAAKDAPAAWAAYGSSAAFVAAATALAALVRTLLAPSDLVMLYLLAIMAAALRFGRGPSVVASALSVVAFDFFFVPPFFTFAVADQRYLVTFATLFVVGLIVSELTRRARRLAEQAEAAALRARTEQIRSALLSAVSHDLRTPLGAITGAATTLRDPSVQLDAPERAELLDSICEEAERLERFVGNLLDMTRLESGAVEVKREWVPMEEVVGASLTRLEARLGARPIAIDLPADLPLVPIDPVLVEQALVNLLDNAAKHTPSGSAIEIAARRDGRAVEIDVADRGPGLPPGGEERVFEKFFRRARAGVAGSGLGLPICLGIAQAHGGTLTAEGRPGGGAVFRMRLPIVGDAPAVAREETTP